MVFKPRDPFHPPHGRIDGVIYYGAIAVSQPLMPVAYDEVGVILDRWDSATASWLPVSIADSQLSADVVLAPAGVLPVLDASNLTNVPEPAKLLIGTAPGAFGVTTFVSVPGMLATAVIVLGIRADVGEDSFGNSIEQVGLAVAGGFSYIVSGPGFDSSFDISWIGFNP